MYANKLPEGRPQLWDGQTRPVGPLCGWACRPCNGEASAEPLAGRQQRLPAHGPARAAEKKAAFSAALRQSVYASLWRNFW